MTEMLLKIFLRKLRNDLDGMFVLRRKNLYAMRKYFKGDVLEVGVGYGPDIDFIKKLKGVKSYYGADREEYYYTYTKDKVNDSNIVYYKGETLPFNNGRFDTVVSVDCLEHLHPKETDSFFNEINRVLKKSGNFIVSAPFIYPEHCEPYDYLRYTRYGMIELVKGFGFKDVEVRARSSASETFLVNLNHWLFFNLFPNNFTNEFSADKSRKTCIIEVFKYAFLPVASILYLTIFIILKVLIGIPKKREKSAFSLGYSVVFKKR